MPFAIRSMIVGAYVNWYLAEVENGRKAGSDMLLLSMLNCCMWSQTEQSFKQKDVQWWVENIEKLCTIKGNSEGESRILFCG